MPTVQYRRIWCKTCGEFTLHRVPYDFDNEKHALKCKECDTEYSSIRICDIPQEKVWEQRERYKAKNRERLTSMFKEFTKTSDERLVEDLLHMFSSPGSDIEISESDAGQKDIDEEDKKIRDVQWEERRRIRVEQEEEAAKYAKLNRNDICICGSGIKFKKCCLPRIQTYHI